MIYIENYIQKAFALSGFCQLQFQDGVVVRTHTEQ